MPKNALKAPFGFYKSLIDQIKTNKKAFAIFMILRLAVVIVIIRCIFEKRYECVFTGLLALLLLLLPAFVEKQLKIELPTVLETIAYFLFSAPRSSVRSPAFIRASHSGIQCSTLQADLFSRLSGFACSIF